MLVARRSKAPYWKVAFGDDFAARPASVTADMPRPASGRPRAFTVLLTLQGIQATCVPRGSFTPLDFPSSTLVRSNLGGQGGKCTSTAICDEVTNSGTPHEVYIRNVATSPAGASVDLRITNASEYKASRPENNGLTATKYFAEVNLFGPTTGGTWDSNFTG